LPGDIIVHVGTSEVLQFTDLQQEINRHIPGDDIEVKLHRGGQVKTLQLQLGRFPDQ
jgi:S1-C subfamily serine protease